MSRVTKIEISHRTILFTLAVLVLLWMTYQIRGVILLVFISIILMSALNPGVDFLEKYKVPRIVSILLFYILTIGFISSVVAVLVPPLVEQTGRLISVTPKLLTNLAWLQLNPSVLVQQLSALPSNVLRFTVSAVSNIIIVFTVLVFTFYLLLERKNLKRHLMAAFGSDGEAKAEAFVDEVELQLGRWVRGQLFSMTLVGILCYAGLRLLGIEFALPLAILAGLLEIIPNMGPIVSAIPAMVIALATAPTLVLGVAALYFAVQQLQAQVITPNVMRQAVGFNPLVTMLALMAGFTLAGFAGAILALPVLLITQVVAGTVMKSRRVV
ncbi:MAG: AI-2E family transporter [Candidatus Chisholmbacteria bacterium]|nr:AI-2E family transporter [Candidatus Chisholmbacteria bacterium]